MDEFGNSGMYGLPAGMAQYPVHPAQAQNAYLQYQFAPVRERVAAVCERLK